MLANSDAETVYRWMGYGKESFIKKLDTGLSDLTTIRQKETRFSKNPDLSTALALAEYNASTGGYKGAIGYYNEVKHLDKSMDYAFEIYRIYADGFYRQEFSKEEYTDAVDAALASPQVTDGSKLNILIGISHQVSANREDERFLSYLEKAKKMLDESKQKLSPQMTDNFIAIYILYIEKDESRAVAAKKQSLPQGWEENPDDLNEISWWCFENKVNLTEAALLARKAVNLATNPKNKSMFLDTLAEIVFLQGDALQAIALIKEAQQNDPQNEYYQKQEQKFSTTGKK